MARNVTLRVRVSDEEKKMLDEIQKLAALLNSSEAVRYSIRIAYSSIVVAKSQGSGS